MFARPIKLNEALENNNVVVIYGARQVGKTTLVKQYLETYKGKNAYYTRDDLEFADSVSKCSLDLFKKMFTGFSSKSKVSYPKEFINTYDNSKFEIVNRDNYFDFVNY